MTKDTDTYFSRLSDDAHGYIRFARRLLWVVGTLLAAAIVAAILIIATAGSAS